ncbi:MAG: hypothetical protein AAFX45_10525, partial [Pseudomonadota bacterium]
KELQMTANLLSGNVPRISDVNDILHDRIQLKQLGVAAIYTPKDFELNAIMQDIVHIADPGHVAAE